jgi:hypothetical protein
MPSRNSTRYIKTLAMAYKVRFLVWQEEGMSTTAVANCSGRQCTSIKCLLIEARTSARRPSLREINGMLTIEKTCFEGSEFC